MSDDVAFQRMQQDVLRRAGQIEVAERAPLYLPWTQRALNPFPLASSGTVWGDMSQPWAVNLLVWAVSVFVSGTNNATNFWTLTLINPAATILATLSTAAIAPGAWVRLSTTAITQPAAANVTLSIIATATLSPGAIYVAPALALLRSGN